MHAALQRTSGIALLMAALAGGCSRRDAAGDSRATAPPREVRIAIATERPMERVVLATGSLLAYEQTTLSVKVAGRLQSLAVDLGSGVKAGAVVAQVEARDYELRAQQAEAALAQARATLGLPLEGTEDRLPPEETSPVRQAKAVLDEAAKNRERVLRLAQQGISSSSEQDTVEAAFKVAESRYQSALDDARTRQAALAQRRAELDLARQQLADTTVRAPFDGTIQARVANLGEFLAAGSPVVRLVKTSPLRLRLEVPERQAQPLREGQTVRFTIEGGTNLHEATLARLSPALTEQSRVLIAEADVPNDGSLRAGAFVRAGVVVDKNDRGIAVPAAALVLFAGLEKVLLIRDGKAVERVVETGRRGPDWVEIVSGLESNTPVVLEPGNLQTGQPVTVITPAGGSPTASAP